MDIINTLVYNNKALFIIYLLIASNYLNALYNCRIQQLFETNMYVKHLFGFLTLYFFVVLTDPQFANKPALDNIKLTLTLYIFFVLTTKMNHYIFFIVWFLLLTCITISGYAENATDEESKKRYEGMARKLTYLTVFLIIVGFLVYLGQKKTEYNKNFDYKRFFFGIPSCKGTTSSKATITSSNDIFKFIGRAFY